MSLRKAANCVTEWATENLAMLRLRQSFLGLVVAILSCVACGQLDAVHVGRVSTPTPLRIFEEEHLELVSSRLIYWKAEVTPEQAASVFRNSNAIDALEEEAFLIRANPDLKTVDDLKEAGTQIVRLESLIQEVQNKIDLEKAGANRPARIKRYEAEKLRYTDELAATRSDFEKRLTPEKKNIWAQVQRLQTINRLIPDLIAGIQKNCMGAIRTDTKLALGLASDGSLTDGYIYGLENAEGTKQMAFSLEPGASNTIASLTSDGISYWKQGGVLKFAALRNPFLRSADEPSERYEFQLARTRYSDSDEVGRSLFSGELTVRSATGEILHKGVAKFMDKAL